MTEKENKRQSTHYLDLYINDSSDFSTLSPLSLSIGNFDGIHKGHFNLLNFITTSKDKDTKSLVISFKSSLGSIFNTSQKLSGFKELGINYTLLLPDTIKSLSYKQFLSFLEQFNIKSIVVGENFRFGNLREGSYLDIQQKFKDIVFIPNYVKDSQHSKIISSTRIKTEILNQSIPQAIDMLNHPLILEGNIISGIHEASSLGFPTINIKPSSISIPNGVYLGYTYLTSTNNSTSLITSSYESLYDKNLYYEYIYDLKYNIPDSNIDLVIKVHRFKNIDTIKYVLSTDAISSKLIKSLIHIGGRPTLEKITNTTSSSNISILVESHLLLEGTNNNSNTLNNNYGIFYITDFIEKEKTFNSKEDLISALNHYRYLAKNMK